MVSSYFRWPNQEQGEYSRINSLTSDVELEKRQLIDNNDDASEDSDALPPRRIISGQSRRPRRILLLAIVCSVFLAASLFAAFTSHQRTSAETTQNWQLGDGPHCVKCSYSALPAYPPPFASHEAFTEEALDLWVSKGRLPASNKLDFSNHTRIDTITLWVNGSDPRHIAARAQFAADVDRVDYQPPTAKRQKRDTDKDRELQNEDLRYREQNELLYNLRSSGKNLKDLGTMHVIATDFWDNGENQVNDIQDREFEGRRGQVPSWLNMTSDALAFGREVRHDTPLLRFHHDWETFAPLVETRENIKTWKERRLPTFNSMAAEAIVGVNLPGLADYTTLASDDMFLGQPMTTADFATPLYGPVFQLRMYETLDAVRIGNVPGPEFAGLDYSIALLAKRFGTRLFPYLHHVHKTMNKPLVIESRIMWQKEFEEASSKRFRGNGVSANSHLLSYGLIIERHREALLWSFLVAKLDVNGDGKLDRSERERAFHLMGTDGSHGEIVGRMTRRSTMNSENYSQALDSVSFPRPLSTHYKFSSFDGYVLNQPSPEFTRNTDYTLAKGPFASWPSSNESPKEQQRFSAEFCRVSMSICWPDSHNVNTIFTHFAFQEPSCGDCLLTYLVEQSGSAGLEAFLPESSPKMKSKGKWLSLPKVPSWAPAHLSTGNDWRLIDFSLASVASINRAGWKRRAFAVHLIQRYNHIVADSNIGFYLLFNPESARDVSRTLLDTKPSFICINDNIDNNLNETRSVLQDFFNTMWPSNAARLGFEKVT